MASTVDGEEQENNLISLLRMEFTEEINAISVYSRILCEIAKRRNSHPILRLLEVWKIETIKNTI